MKRRLALSLAVAIIAASVSFSAAAGGRRHGGHHGHFGHHGGHHWNFGHHSSHFGFYLGDPFLWGPSYFSRPYSPYYYEPRTVIIEREPPVYIQRTPAAPAAPAPVVSTVWYYCPNPAGYYPHVPNCSQQWVSVDPRSIAPPPPR